MNVWGIFTRPTNSKEEWKLIAIALNEPQANAMVNTLNDYDCTEDYNYEFISAKKAMDWLLGESE